jgi:hypothetical protein
MIKVTSFMCFNALDNDLRTFELMGFNLYFGKSRNCVRKSEETSSLLTPLDLELEFVLNMKVVGLVLSFPTHIHPSHLDQRSPGYNRFGETGFSCAVELALASAERAGGE